MSGKKVSFSNSSQVGFLKNIGPNVLMQMRQVLMHADSLFKEFAADSVTEGVRDLKQLASVVQHELDEFSLRAKFQYSVGEGLRTAVINLRYELLAANCFSNSEHIAWAQVLQDFCDFVFACDRSLREMNDFEASREKSVLKIKSDTWGRIRQYIKAFEQSTKSSDDALEGVREMLVSMGISQKVRSPDVSHPSQKMDVDNDCESVLPPTP